MDDDATFDGSEKILEMTVNIVAAYVGNHVVPMGDIGSLVADVHTVLRNLISHNPGQDNLPTERLKPAVPIRKSIENGLLYCLEDGMKFKSLKRHLMTHHNMTPEEYRIKWNLASDYPMVSREYANTRSKLAKNMGLGRGRKKR
ncbi:Transcriptional regulatory protein MucR [Candidatus Liberibacter solanacearum]|uniref:Transcriptional regulator n=2 Tax=Candidatus Liberibacter solanacearum TaxID=556287 RepID=A0A094Z2Q9_9HYPH|nr:MucR family transcriptional regulator [Candidatus Liberibacter solanacearum]ADR52006.1 transcription regulator protein [Candidatus Liberibacter solanacearum CLso-ZC1]KGB27937.1 transcriptional regulator [Candidatus Liberibacter solanacearum]KJZ80960.1 transcriptional regulator [Candidatus Liberibacter solanacearum]KJZ82128.1 transcriptional regulator [Candidatus Liberibacter solanacearum]KQC49463.1 transcriptional regulator [Candidatus Liberibacter solanacearum]